MHAYKAYKVFANDVCMVVLYLFYLTQYFGSFPFKISLTIKVITNGKNCTRITAIFMVLRIGIM